MPSLSRSSFLKHSLHTGLVLSLSTWSRDLLAFSEEDAVLHKTDPFRFAESLGWTEPMEKVLLAGLTAPNSHNSQPWKFQKTSASSFLLFADNERQLLPIDPKNRQLFHSQGTFLELSLLALEALGLVSQIALFPKGKVGFSEPGSKPIASVSWKPGKETPIKTLFHAIPKRQMNRSPYSGPLLTEEESKELTLLANPKFSKLLFVWEQRKIDELKPCFIEAYKQEVADPLKNNVSRDYFRLSDKEIYSKRDGITLQGNGLQNPKLWFAKNFFVDLEEKAWNSPASINASNQIYEAAVNSAKGFVFLITQGTDSEEVWVQTGRDFMRLCLAIADKDLSFHSMNQAFVDYPQSLDSHKQFQKVLGLDKSQRIQLAGRIGRSDYKFASPRRALESFLI